MTLGLVSISLAFLMSGEAMNLTAGILVFLAALIPIIARLWRSASQKGQHRRLLSITASLIGFLFFAGGDIGWIFGMHFGLVYLFLLISAAILLVSFVVEDSPMGRHQVAAFAMSLAGVAGLLVIIAGSQLAIVTVRKSQADLLKEITAAPAMRSPTPSVSPTAPTN